MHGCPCGHYGDPTKACTCAEGMVQRYQRRISGPLLDRIDLFTEVPRVEYEKLAAAVGGEPSAAVRARVAAARSLQQERFGPCGRINAGMTPREVWLHCQEQMAPEAAALLKMAMLQLSVSARAFHRVLKVARTIADLAAADRIEAAYLAEAVQYRRRYGER